jgi:hypothetical protein
VAAPRTTTPEFRAAQVLWRGLGAFRFSLQLSKFFFARPGNSICSISFACELPCMATTDSNMVGSLCLSTVAYYAVLLPVQGLEPDSRKRDVEQPAAQPRARCECDKKPRPAPTPAKPADRHSIFSREHALADINLKQHPSPCSPGCSTIARFRRATNQKLAIDDTSIDGSPLWDIYGKPPELLSPKFGKGGSCKPEWHTELIHFPAMCEHVFDSSGVHFEGHARHIRICSTFWICPNCCVEFLVRMLWIIAQDQQIESLSLCMRDPYHRPAHGPQDRWLDCIRSMRDVLGSAVQLDSELQGGLDKLHVWVLSPCIEVASVPLMVAGTWLSDDPRTAAMRRDDAASEAAQKARAALKLTRSILPPSTEI